MTNDVGDRAVVLGGSMAGLLTVRVLAEAYREVFVVDRDELSGQRDPRRGVPQGNHAHALLARGQQILERLFPGFTDELIAADVPIGDMGRMRWFVNGHRLRPVQTGLIAITAARPNLDAHVRARVAALPGVKFKEHHDIIGLATTPDHGRVIGARVQRRVEGSPEEVLHADLVVDATGRGSRAPVWLEELGYERPGEERVKIDLAYTTRQYRLSSDPFHGEQSINPLATHSHPRGAFFGGIGGDRAILSLTGMLGDHPPTDIDGFNAYVRSLPIPDIWDAIRDAEPITDPICFHFSASVRRHYEWLSRFPDGFLVVGDAVCSFNPVYGQGMTVAALEALTLRRHLEQGTEPQPRRFLRDIAKVINEAWDISAGGDLAWPGAEGRRTVKVRLSNVYINRLQIAASNDAKIADGFLRVAGLVDPPPSLMRPSMALRVLRHARYQPESPQPLQSDGSANVGSTG